MDRLPYKKPEGLPKPVELNFKVLNEPLEQVTTAVINLLEREKRQPRRLYFLLWGLLSTTEQTYKAIRRLLVRKPAYGAQAHFLLRYLIETLFTITVVAEDPDENSRRYFVSGYRDMWEEYQKIEERDRDYPEWHVMLKLRKQLLDDMAADLKLSSQEKDAPRQHIGQWPNPSQVVKPESKWVSDTKKEFLRVIAGDRYKPASEMAHMAMRGMSLGVFATKTEEHWDPGKLESDAVCGAILFQAMILSEIQALCQYADLEQRLRYLWTLLTSLWEEATDYYRLRYDSLLRP